MRYWMLCNVKGKTSTLILYIIVLNTIIISIQCFHAYDINKFNKLRLLYDDHQINSNSNSNIDNTNGYNNNSIEESTPTNSTFTREDTSSTTPLSDHSRCQSYYNATRPYTHDFITKLSLWPNLMSHYDRAYGELSLIHI